MEDTCPNESPDNFVVKLASKTHCSFHIRLSRHPGQSAWHRSSTPSSLQDANSAVTSCTLPSACASGVLSYSSQLDLQSVRDTATVAAASTNGLQQGTLAQAQLLLASNCAFRPCLTGSLQMPSRCTATALGTSCTCRFPSRRTTWHRAAPSKLHLQRYAEHGTNRPAVSQPITAPCRQPSIAQWSQTRCDTAADAEATCCLLANAQATRTDLVAGPHRHIPKLPCCPPVVGFAAGLGCPPGNPAGDVIGSSAPEMLWWPPDYAGGGGRDDSSCRAFSVSDSLLQLYADGSVGPLITAPPSPTSQWMLHHSWSQPPKTSGDTVCIAPSDLPAGPWLSISARAAAPKLSPENLTAVAGVAAALWPGALHGRSSPAGVAIPGDPDPGLNKSYIQFAAAQGTPLWAAPAPTCSSLGDSCASPALSSPSTPRSSSGNARQQARGALVEFYRKHCAAGDGDAMTVALETGGLMLAHQESSEAGGLGAGTQMLHPGTPAGGRNHGSGRHVIARSVPQLKDISVPARVKGAGGENGGNSRLRRAATGAPRFGCSPTQQQLLQGLYGNGSHSGGDGGCRITAAVMRSSSSPLSTHASSAGGAKLSHNHNHSINIRHLAAKAASKAAAMATATAAASATATATADAGIAASSLHPQAVIADGTGSRRAVAVASPPRSFSAQEVPNGQATAVARQSLAPPPAMISLPVPVMGRSSLGSGGSSSRAAGSACSPASSSSPISSSPLVQVAPQLVPEHHALRLISCTLRASEVKRAPGVRAGRVLTPEELSRRMLAETGGGGATKLLLTLAAGGTAELPPPASRSPRGTFPPIAEDEAGPQEGGPAAKTGGEYTWNDSECRLQPGCGCIVM